MQATLRALAGASIAFATLALALVGASPSMPNATIVSVLPDELRAIRVGQEPAEPDKHELGEFEVVHYWRCDAENIVSVKCDACAQVVNQAGAVIRSRKCQYPYEWDMLKCIYSGVQTHKCKFNWYSPCGSNFEFNTTDCSGGSMGGGDCKKADCFPGW